MLSSGGMIRPATLSDADAIAEIQVNGWRAAYAGIMPEAFLADLSTAERAAGWRRGIERDGNMVHVYEDSGIIHGWIAVGKSREDEGASAGEIYALYVDPSHWRRAIGGALVQHAEQNLWARGFQSVALWVLEQNRVGRSFYAKCGYADDGGRKTEEMAGAKLVELRLRKRNHN